MKKSIARIFWGYTIIVIIISLIPIHGIHLEKIKITLGPLYLRLDYFLHALMFITFSFIYFIAHRYKVSIFKRRPIRTLFILLFMLAIFTEVFQMMIPGRSFYILDMISNIIGTILGIAILSLTIRKRKNETTVQNELHSKIQSH